MLRRVRKTIVRDTKVGVQLHWNKSRGVRAPGLPPVTVPVQSAPDSAAVYTLLVGSKYFVNLLARYVDCNVIYLLHCTRLTLLQQLVVTASFLF
jgi:hypothetical protein